MADLLKMARQLISIAEDLRDRLGIYYPDRCDHLYDFDQTWASTALGFGGIGGSAMTTERTYVYVMDDAEIACVYFGGTFAYKTHINDRFWEDIKKHDMASVMESYRYEK